VVGGLLRQNPRVNNWLRARRVRVLLPLVWASSFAAALLGGLVYSAAVAGSVSHPFPWRELFFGSVLVTLAAVTGIKTRHQDSEPADAV
jgi:hypothetical protein